jgi:hypothetical protein
MLRNEASMSYARYWSFRLLVYSRLGTSGADNAPVQRGEVGQASVTASQEPGDEVDVDGGTGSVLYGVKSLSDASGSVAVRMSISVR